MTRCTIQAPRRHPLASGRLSSISCTASMIYALVEFGTCWFGSERTTTFLLHAAAGKDGKQRAEDRRGQINQQICQLSGHEGWSQKPRRIHRRGGDRAGKQRFEGGDRADRDASRDAFFLRTTHVVDDACCRPGKDEEKRPKQFCCRFLHILVESDMRGKRPSIARLSDTRS